MNLKRKKSFTIKGSLLLGLFMMFACSEKKQGEPEQISETLPYYQDASFTPQWLEEGSLVLEEFHRIPEFSLLNQVGDTITEKNLDGKLVVADFFFTTCPGICPKMTRNMQWVQEAFKENPSVLLLSHSVTPEYDSIPVLAKYAKDYDIQGDKWHLLTGDRKQIYALGRQSYFVEEDLGIPKNEFDFLHTENFVLLDRQRRIRGIYNGLNKRSVQQLIDDIKLLLGESS